MTILAAAYQHVDALSALFEEVQAEKAMSFDATKESSYVASDRRAARSGRAPTGRWAILDVADGVVGYLTGSFKQQLPGTNVVGAFISQIVVSSGMRRSGRGRDAILEFARLARDEVGATTVGLRLDETGDVNERRIRFERIGFEFTGLVGTARIDDLLSEAGELR